MWINSSVAATLHSDSSGLALAHSEVVLHWSRVHWPWSLGLVLTSMHLTIHLATMASCCLRCFLLFGLTSTTFLCCSGESGLALRFFCQGRQFMRSSHYQCVLGAIIGLGCRGRSARPTLSSSCVKLMECSDVTDGMIRQKCCDATSK